MSTQDLCYANLPSKSLPCNKTNSIKTIKNLTFLKNIQNTYFVYLDIGNIDFAFLNQDPKIYKKLAKRHVEIFLYEPASYYFKGKEFNLDYYSEFHSKLNYSQNLRSAELDSINQLGKKIGSITLNHCDYKLSEFLGQRYPFIKMQCRDIFIRLSAKSYITYDLNEVKTITKKFWCGNGRYTIHRHIIMCYLADKSGNYSWWYNSDTDWNIENNWLENNLDFHHLNENNKILNSKTFQLDFPATVIKVNKKNRTYISNLPFPAPNVKKYKETFDPCFVCIINETRFAQPTGNFSEKTLDAINFRKPFILVAPPNTLEYLKKFGFKTFSKYWSEKYDQIENHTDRLIEIFTLIDFINSKTLEELNDMYLDMLDILDYNREILKDLPRNPQVITDRNN